MLYYGAFGDTNFGSMDREGGTMELKKTSITLILLMLLLFITGCGEAGNQAEKQEEQKEMPREISELEKGLLSIMQQADLIPLMQLEQAQQAGQQEKEEETLPEGELTFEETILAEILKKEGEGVGLDDPEQEMPENTEIIWDNIKETVTELYDHWGVLEPLLVMENITQNVISDFAEGLDSLTVFITEQNHFNTMFLANQITEDLAEFMVPYTENIVSLTYELKFHMRNIVLETAMDNYAGAQQSLDYVKEHRPDLAKALDESEFREFELSLENLQRVLDKQNLDLVILNAAVVMEDLTRVIEKTTAS